MASRYFRAQILIEPEQHHELAEMARRQHRSVSDVVREYLGERLARERQDAEAERARRMANWDEILQFREKMLANRGGKAHRLRLRPGVE